VQRETLPFPFLDELRADGYCDYVVAPLFYSDGTPNALSWARPTTYQQNPFCDKFSIKDY